MAWLHKQPMFTRNVRFVFFSAIVALAAATFVYLGLIAVGSNAGFGCVYGLIAAVATAATVDRLWRLIGFLHRLMGVALSDKENPSPRNPEFTESMDD